jgi:signal transduction histidine kinase/sugar phosphate isomerase/epimerase
MIVVALSSWSLHTEFLNPGTSGLSAEQFPRLARQQFGVAHIEFYEGDYADDFLNPACDERYAERIRDRCEEEQVKVCCIAAVNDLTTEDATERERHRERLRKWAKHAQVLDCPVIRVNSGRQRLNAVRVPRFVEQLWRLADEIEKFPVRLAVENHPHVLRSDADTELLLEVIQRVNRPNVRTCPDVGAMGPGYWNEGLRRLAPYAVHVHLKPSVPVPEADGRVAACGLDAYGPEARYILEGSGYHGAVAVEYTHYRDAGANAYEATRKTVVEAARVFGMGLRYAPQPRSKVRGPAHSTRLTVNQDAELTPAQGILQLLADGCELRLDAQIHIHDFATGKHVSSQSAAHRQDGGQGCPERAAFCALADSDARAGPECQSFYGATLDRIRSGEQDQPHLRICPMGLMTLSVPVKDQSHLYGAIVCGPWVEEGTEGMITDSVLYHTEPGSQEAMEQASLKLRPYSRHRLQASQRLLETLAQDLAGLYEERFRAKYYLLEGTRIINDLREKGHTASRPDPTPDGLIRSLPAVFESFQQVVGFGQIALYQRQDGAESAAGTTTRELVRKVQAGPHGALPIQVRVTVAPTEDFTDQVRRELTEQIKGQTGLSCLSPVRRESHAFAVFCYRPDRQLPSNLRHLIDQFAAEVEYILSNLRNLADTSEARKSLEIFLDRCKHALASPLQGISDRTLQLRKLLDKSNFTLQQLRTLSTDFQQFSTEAGAVLYRFTGRVRVTGRGSLRSQFSFAAVDTEHILEEAIRKWSRAAQKRQIRLQRIGPAGDGLLQGDRSALDEIFGNLVENAVKFANDGASINVSSQDSGSIPTRPEPRTAPLVKVVAGDCFWVITSRSATVNLTPPWWLPVPGRRFVIEDMGVGIAESDARRLFEPYVQGQVSPPGRVIRGTGLGLAICLDLVKAHGGRIAITSKPARGTPQKPDSEENLQEAVVSVYVDLPFGMPRITKGEPQGGT